MIDGMSIPMIDGYFLVRLPVLHFPLGGVRRGRDPYCSCFFFFFIPLRF